MTCWVSELDKCLIISNHQQMSHAKLIFAAELAEILSTDMQKEGLCGRTLTLKLKTASFEVLVMSWLCFFLIISWLWSRSILWLGLSPLWIKLDWKKKNGYDDLLIFLDFSLSPFREMLWSPCIILSYYISLASANKCTIYRFGLEPWLYKST